jgi:hypothetical protein
MEPLHNAENEKQIEATQAWELFPTLCKCTHLLVGVGGGVGDSPRRGFRPTILAMAGASCLSVRARPVFIGLIWGMQGHSAGSQIEEAGGLRHHHWESIGMSVSLYYDNSTKKRL